VSANSGGECSGTDAKKVTALFTKANYEGWFCAPCAAYKTEDEYLKAEQPDEPPTCLIHELPLDRVLLKESYFFRLSDMTKRLLAAVRVATRTLSGGNREGTK